MYVEYCMCLPFSFTKISCLIHLFSSTEVATSGTATLEAIPSIFTELTAVKGKEFSIFALVDMMKNS